MVKDAKGAPGSSRPTWPFSQQDLPHQESSDTLQRQLQPFESVLSRSNALRRLHEHLNDLFYYIKGFCFDNIPRARGEKFK